jgi:hypothetical protein
MSRRSRALIVVLYRRTTSQATRARSGRPANSSASAGSSRCTVALVSSQSTRWAIAPSGSARSRSRMACSIWAWLVPATRSRATWAAMPRARRSVVASGNGWDPGSGPSVRRLVVFIGGSFLGEGRGG